MLVRRQEPEYERVDLGVHECLEGIVHHSVSNHPRGPLESRRDEQKAEVSTAGGGPRVATVPMALVVELEELRLEVLAEAGLDARQAPLCFSIPRAHR